MDVTEKEDLLITCKSGITIRMPVQGISELGRATQGVKLIRVDEGDEIAAITKVDEQEIEDENPEIAANGTENSEIAHPDENTLTDGNPESGNEDDDIRY